MFVDKVYLNYVLISWYLDSRFRGNDDKSMIIFYYGENTFLSRQKLRELQDKFTREVDPTGENLSVLDGTVIDFGRINEAMSSQSLFVRKRMVIVENILQNKSKVLGEQLIEYLKNLKEANDNIIIFWDSVSGEKLGANKLFKFLSTQKFVQQFLPLSNTDATAWVKKEVENQGAKITQSVAMHLTALFVSDLWQLSNEIAKLISYKKSLNNKGEIEIEIKDIEMMSRGVVDENIFAMTDAISNKNKSLAVQLFEKEIEAGVAEHYLIHMIARQFKILMQVRQALDSGHSSRKIIGDLKLHPFVVQKASAQVRNFNLEVLKNIYLKLVEMDYLFKTGQGDLMSLISLFMAKI